MWLLMLAEITLLETMKMTNWLVMIHTRPLLGQECVISLLGRRTNWSGSTKSTQVWADTTGLDVWILNPESCLSSAGNIINTFYIHVQNPRHLSRCMSPSWLSIEKCLASVKSRHFPNFSWLLRIKQSRVTQGVVRQRVVCIFVTQYLCYATDWDQLGHILCQPSLCSDVSRYQHPSTLALQRKLYWQRFQYFFITLYFFEKQDVSAGSVPLESRPNILGAIYGCLTKGLLLKALTNNGGVRNMITPWRNFIFC